VNYRTAAGGLALEEARSEPLEQEIDRRNDFRPPMLE
jgi:hypothetical protein